MQNGALSEIARVWKTAKTVVVFTGAGMSTESGLPDFRSAQGMWKQRPESLATLGALSQTPDEFYFFYQWRIKQLGGVCPNAGHLALALLEKTGRVKHLITQNVDGLHQLAGSDRVSELHGTLRTVSCLKCRKSFDNRNFLPTRDDWEAEYRDGTYHHGPECFCPDCGGNLRPDVVLFGEAVPKEAWRESEEWSGRADLFVVIGSSLLVSPANLLPQQAVQAGAKLLIINQDPTPLDHLATWCLRTKAAETLPAIVAAMNGGSDGEIHHCANKEEMVFSGGVEGGGMELFRRSFADGVQDFYIKIGAMNMDENDAKIWENTEMRFSSWDEAWSYMLKQEFHLMYPVFIHPEFRGQIAGYLEHYQNRHRYWTEHVQRHWIQMLNNDLC